MYSLIEGINFDYDYLDNLLILGNRCCKDYLVEAKQVLQWLKLAGLKVETKKCNFAITKLECLRFISSRDIIKAIKKAQGMLNVNPLKRVNNHNIFRTY